MTTLHEAMNENVCSSSFLEGKLTRLLADNRIKGLPINFLADYSLVDGGYGFLTYATHATIGLYVENQEAVLFGWKFDSSKGWDVVPVFQVFQCGE
jgi:hypothetical protein